MNKEKMIVIIEKEFGINSVGCPWGSCKEDFLNNKIIEIAKKHNFPEDVISLFKENPYKFSRHQYFDNGRGAGKYFIGLLNEI